METKNEERWFAQMSIGVKDKNGIMIREGDILYHGKRRFIVTYDPEIVTFKAVPETPSRSYPCLNYGTARTLTIVGSIYNKNEKENEE